MTAQRQRARVLALSAAGVGVLVLAVPLLLGRRIQEEWLLWQLQDADEVEQVRIGRRLGQLESVRAARAFLDLQSSEWEQQWAGEDVLLEELFSGASGPVDACSPAGYGLRALGPSKAVLRELKRTGESLPHPEEWASMSQEPYVAAIRIVVALSAFPEARDELAESWGRSQHVAVRMIAALSLAWMEDSPEVRVALKRIAAGEDGEWLPRQVFERLGVSVR